MQRDNTRTRYDWIIFAATVAGLGLLLNFLTELTYSGDIGAVFSAGFLPWLLSYLIVVAVSLVFIAIVGNAFLGYALSSIVFITLVCVNLLKYATLNEVFVPSDLFKAGLAARFGHGISLGLPPVFWLFLGLWFVTLLVVYVFMPSAKVSPVTRICLFTASVAFLFFMLTASTFKLKLMSDWGIRYNMLEPEYTYHNNGIILGFTLHMRSELITKPDIYDNIAEEYDMALAQGVDVPDTAPLVDPYNIIFFLSESFFDPSNINLLNTYNDPIPTYHKLAKKFPSGSLIVPSYGGATINTEFEILTGLSTAFLPRGTYPFLQYMRGDMHTIASVFTDKGYRTIGVHTYDKTFYSRDTVYPMLGVSEFYGENDMQKYDLSGGYLSDMLMSWAIVDIINDKTGDDSAVKTSTRKSQTKQPKFIFAISMENHLPYSADKYPQDDVNVLNDNLADTDKQILTSYLNGIKKSDEALEWLTTELSKVNERTLLVFFGDHLPPFPNQAIYKDLGYIANDKQLDFTVKESYDMHKTPLLIWANFPIEKQDIAIGSSFLSSFVLNNYTSVHDDSYFNLNSYIGTELTAINAQLILGRDGTLSKSAPASLQSRVSLFEGMVYDVLFGSNKIKAK